VQIIFSIDRSTGKYKYAAEAIFLMKAWKKIKELKATTKH